MYMILNYKILLNKYNYHGSRTLTLACSNCCASLFFTSFNCMDNIFHLKTTFFFALHIGYFNYIINSRGYSKTVTSYTVCTVFLLT